MGKRLYEMTLTELRAEAERYEQAGNKMWADLCWQQIGLHHQIADAFNRHRSTEPQSGEPK